MKPNIIIQAPVFSVSGYGAHARDIVLALFDSGRYNVSIAPTQWGGSSTTDKFSIDTMEKLTYMVNNRISTEDFVFVHIGVPHEFRKLGKVNIGITAGLESDSIPASWIPACNQMDAVIVPSTFVRDLFIRKGVSCPVFVVEEGIDTTLYNESVKCNLNIEFDTKFNFFTSGQWMQGNQGGERKQIGLLLDLFCQAFADDKDVGLVIKTQTLNNASPDFFFTRERIQMAKQDRAYPKIHLIHGVMTEQEISQLYHHPQIKAFVSTTSGESWFRPLAEAAASDLPVLVTGWSGHMDFIDPNLATVFDYKMVSVPPSAWQKNLHGPGMNWAFVESEDVKRKMHRCVERYSVAQERAVKLGVSVRKNFNLKLVNAKLVDVFDGVLLSVKKAGPTANLLNLDVV